MTTDKHLRFDQHGQRVIQCWCGQQNLYSTSETVRSGYERHSFKWCYPVPTRSAPGGGQ